MVAKFPKLLHFSTYGDCTVIGGFTDEAAQKCILLQKLRRRNQLQSNEP